MVTLSPVSFDQAIQVIGFSKGEHFFGSIRVFPWVTYNVDRLVIAEERPVLPRNLMTDQEKRHAGETKTGDAP